MSATPNFSHPENDLYDDDPSRLTQNPRSLDELAHSPDPYMRAGKDEESSRQALRFLIWAMAGSFIVGLGSLVITRLLGGTLCESGEAAWLGLNAKKCVFTACRQFPRSGLSGYRLNVCIQHRYPGRRRLVVLFAGRLC